MRISLAVTLATLVCAPVLAAQTPGGRAQALRRNVEEAFMRRAQQQLGLDDAQTRAMAGVVREAGEQRRTIEAEERRLRTALQQQLRPGVAARPDSVDRLVDEISRNRIAYAESFRTELQQLREVLTPVQRGLYLQMRDQLLQRVRELQQARPPGAGRPPQ